MKKLIVKRKELTKKRSVHANPTFTMIVGLPRSGKSTYVKKHRDFCVVIDDNEIRKMFGVNLCLNDSDDFSYMVTNGIIKYELLNGNNVIFDSTNIDYKYRINLLKILENVPCRKVCVVVATPFEVCIDNCDSNIDLQNSVINLYKKFTPPSKGEGWDYITVYYYKRSFMSLYGSPVEYIYQTSDYNLRNSHHKLSLGTHSASVGKDLSKYNELLENAGYLHDCGKPICQEMNRSDSNESFVKYPNHEKVGSYNSFFYDTNLDYDGRLELSRLVRWHIQPLYGKIDSRTQKLLGPKTWESVLKLRKADLEFC